MASLPPASGANPSAIMDLVDLPALSRTTESRSRREHGVADFRSVPKCFLAYARTPEILSPNDGNPRRTSPG